MEIKAYFETTGSTGYGMKKVGGWVTFPIEEEALIEKFKEFSKNIPTYSQYMFRIKEWEAPDFVTDELDLPNRGFNLEQVNSTVEHLRNIDEEDYPIVKALLEKDYDLEDACRIVAEEEYDDLRNQDDEDIIRDFMDDHYDVPDYILDNIDWSDVADDFFDEEDGFVYVGTGDKQGYIRVTD